MHRVIVRFGVFPFCWSDRRVSPIKQRSELRSSAHQGLHYKYSCITRKPSLEIDKDRSTPLPMQHCQTPSQFPSTPPSRYDFTIPPLPSTTTPPVHLRSVLCEEYKTPPAPSASLEVSTATLELSPTKLKTSTRHSSLLEVCSAFLELSPTGDHGILRRQVLPIWYVASAQIQRVIGQRKLQRKK